MDLQEYIRKGSLFRRFSDMEYFRQFYINQELGVLCWPDGLDIAPEILYHKATPLLLPGWMKPEAAEMRKKAT